MGGKEIGFDVCDDCNAYFGTARKDEPNTNLIFKEIFGAIRAFSRAPTPETYKNLPSRYFDFRYKTNTIKLKSRFSISVITRQFSPINETMLVRIFEIQLKGVVALLDKQHIGIEVTDKAKNLLATRGFTVHVR